MYCSEVLSVQSKPQLGNAGLQAQRCSPVPCSCVVAGSKMLWGMMRDFVCLLGEKWSMGASACQQTARVSAPVGTGEYLEMEKEIYTTPAGTHSLYSQTHTCAWTHRRFYISSSNPLLVASVCRCRWEWVVMSVPDSGGSGHSSPEEPRMQPWGSTRSRDRGGHLMINKQTDAVKTQRPHVQ